MVSMPFDVRLADTAAVLEQLDRMPFRGRSLILRGGDPGPGPSLGASKCSDKAHGGGSLL
jgi:hypothetical protein